VRERFVGSLEIRGRRNCLRCEDQAEQESSMWETDSVTEELQQGQVALLCGGMAGGEATKTFQSKWIKSDNDRPPYYFNVATFLNVIFKDRASLVWRHSTLSRGPLGGGP
jgi:hypothetical protein